LKPDYIPARISLGDLLRHRGDFAGAEAVYRRAVEINPADAEAHSRMGDVLRARGEAAGAEAEYRRAIEINRDDAWAHTKLGEVLLGRGDLAGAEAVYRRLVAINPGDAGAHTRLGNSLRGRGDLTGAEGEYRRVVELKPDDAEAHYNLGTLLRQLGRITEALAALRRAHELGSKQPGWQLPSAELVRDCERLVALEPRLPKVLSGEEGPKDADEAVAFADLCYKTKRYAASARLYEAALTEFPKLSDDLVAQHRYNSACAAALAGAGQGEGVPPPDDAARAQWRTKARAWLRADLAEWERRLVGPPAERARIPTVLAHWKVDPDLAGIRDPDALAKFPEAEREEWRKLWADVDALLKRAGEPPPK
jgi:tetratricopeptide (TPR) repeat protein